MHANYQQNTDSTFCNNMEMYGFKLKHDNLEVCLKLYFNNLVSVSCQRKFLEEIYL